MTGRSFLIVACSIEYSGTSTQAAVSRVSGSDALVREDALLLELPARQFEALYFGNSPAATKLHRVIQKSLLLSLGQTNRHLTRLISQAKLRGAEKEGIELEKAYGGQITAAALSAAL